MAIMCKKCKYIMKKIQVIGYILSDTYDIVKKIAPVITPIIILHYYGFKPEHFGYRNIDSYGTTNDIELSELENKRSYIEGIVVRFFNEQKVTCPLCSKYKGWIDIEENITVKQNKTE